MVQKSFRITLEHIILIKKPRSSIVFSTSNSYPRVPLRSGLRFSVSTVGFLIYRGTNYAPPWYGVQNGTKRHLLKIWAMTGYNNYCFQRLNTTGSPLEVFSGWQRCRKKLAGLEEFASWLVLPILGHVMRKLLDLCIGKGLTLHFAKKASPEGGSLSTDVLHLYATELI